MLRSLPNLQKRPSTSELIDWLQALVIGGIAPIASKGTAFLGGIIEKE